MKSLRPRGVPAAGGTAVPAPLTLNFFFSSLGVPASLRPEPCARHRRPGLREVRKSGHKGRASPRSPARPGVSAPRLPDLGKGGSPRAGKGPLEAGKRGWAPLGRRLPALGPRTLPGPPLTCRGAGAAPRPAASLRAPRPRALMPSAGPPPPKQSRLSPQPRPPGFGGVEAAAGRRRRVCPRAGGASARPGRGHVSRAPPGSLAGCADLSAGSANYGGATADPRGRPDSPRCGSPLPAAGTPSSGHGQAAKLNQGPFGPRGEGGLPGSGLWERGRRGAPLRWSVPSFF